MNSANGAINPLLSHPRVGEDEKIEMLDAGADDFLCKPLGMGELQTWVRVALRRGENAREQVITFDDVTVNLSSHTVTRVGNDLHLTPTEFRLLALLVSNPGKVLTQTHILRQVWGSMADNSQYLHIYHGTFASQIGSRSRPAAAFYYRKRGVVPLRLTRRQRPRARCAARAAA